MQSVNMNRFSIIAFQFIENDDDPQKPYNIIVDKLCNIKIPIEIEDNGKQFSIADCHSAILNNQNKMLLTDNNHMHAMDLSDMK